jgi:hypothetical protein
MSESNSEIVAPYMTGEKKVEASKEPTNKKKCTPFGRCYIVGVSMVTLSFMVVIVASFFQEEYQSVVASLKSSSTVEQVAIETVDTMQDLVITADVVTANDEILTDGVVQAVEQPVQTTAIEPEAYYAYQPFNQPVVQNNVFVNMQQKHRAAIDEAIRQQNVRIAEMNQLRTATFKRMDQDRIERLNRLETMRAKTQAIQQEMQQKMQQAYNDFHSI